MLKKFVSVVMLAGSVGMTFSPFAVSAATTPAAASTDAGSPGQGLEISPPVIELSADPGQTVTANIRLRNVTKGELITKGRADDFGAGTDESGQPKLLLDETGATRFSLKYWVAGVPDLRLAPQELKTSVIKIVVPKNAEPGGHFGVVRFTALPPDLEDTGVALSASVGALILLKVSGVITEKVSLSEFSAQMATKDKAGHPISKKAGFFEHGPIGFLVRVKNEGSVHEKVQGTITVTGWNGKKVAEIKVNEKGGNVLPDSIRRFEQGLDQKRLFGHYTAKLAMNYSSGKTLSGSIGFWVIPWKLILLALVGIVIIGYLLKVGLKRYNEHIISMSRRRR